MRHTTEQNVPISVAAMRLGLTYHQCRAKVLSGVLKGGRDTYGRLFVDAAALDEAILTDPQLSAALTRKSAGDRSGRTR